MDIDKLNSLKWSEYVHRMVGKANRILLGHSFENFRLLVLTLK